MSSLAEGAAIAVVLLAGLIFVFMFKSILHSALGYQTPAENYYPVLLGVTA